MTGVIAALASISKPITAQDICKMQNERLNSATIVKYGDCMETKGATMEWQPIETAPKDGTPIEIMQDGDVFMDHEWFEGAWSMVFYDQAGPYVAQRLTNPTHWRNNSQQRA